MINPKLAVRSLLKSPMVALVAVLSLALGIGANAAIFSLFEQMLLRPLPVREPAQLVSLSSPGPKSGSISSTTSGNSESVFSYPMFRDLQQAETPLSGVAAHREFSANLAFEGSTASAEGVLVSGSYFKILGLQPAAGRLIQPSDDQSFGGHPVVVLSHSYWIDRFSGSDSAIGQNLIVNGNPMSIIGVAPKGFHGTTLGNLPSIYVPITMRETMVPGWKGFDNRRSYWVYMFARLKDGVDLDRAQASVQVVYQRILEQVDAPLQEGMSEPTLALFKARSLDLSDGSRGQSTVHEEVRAPLLLLFGVTAFVLLIACANLANLLLIRAAQRAGEIAVRMSIGARRGQVVAQLLTESFVLALFGATAGFFVAQATLKVLASLIPGADSLGIAFELGPSAWLFVAILSFLIGMVGLFPALHTTRETYAVTLKIQGGRNASSRAANRFRAAMATAQIALSMMLLISAGLLIKSLSNVSKVDLGLDVAEIVTFSLSPELNGYSPEQSRELFTRVEQEIGALPGVEGACASMVPLISGSNWGNNVSVQGFEAGPDTDTNSRFNAVGPGFFKTLGIPLIAGRDIQASDVATSGKVAVVNETFARKFNLGDKAIGTWMQMGSGGEMDIEIVGLVEDAKYSEVKGQIPPVFVLPYRQEDQVGSVSFYVRTSGDARASIPAIRNTVKRLDPNLPIDDLRPFEVQVEENIYLDRTLSLLSSAFAILATLLAAIGLYGVLAYTVVQRNREIGLRMALGADAARVRAWILGKVTVMVGVGTVIGAVAALGFSKLAESLLFELEAHDPVVFLAAILVLAAVSFSAGFVPAHRASQAQPVEVLRDE